MAIVLFDTNIIIDNLAGHVAAAAELSAYDDAVMRRASALRRISITNPPKIAVPDCIIRATAESQARLVITRNPTDFGGAGGLVRVPYDIIDGIATNIKPVPT